MEISSSDIYQPTLKQTLWVRVRISVIRDMFMGGVGIELGLCMGITECVSFFNRSMKLLKRREIKYPGTHLEPLS